MNISKEVLHRGSYVTNAINSGARRNQSEKVNLCFGYDSFAGVRISVSITAVRVSTVSKVVFSNHSFLIFLFSTFSV